PRGAVADAAASDGGGVESEGAVAHRRRPAVDDGAAGVAGDGAIADRQRRQLEAADGAAGAAGGGSASHGQRSAVQHAACARPEGARWAPRGLPPPVNVPPRLAGPPPRAMTTKEVAELPEKVLPLTVAVAPPSLARPPPLVAELPENTLSLTVSAPKLSMPPPLPVPALPPAIVRPEMDTVSPASAGQTREAVPPPTVNGAAAGAVVVQ